MTKQHLFNLKIENSDTGITALVTLSLNAPLTEQLHESTTGIFYADELRRATQSPPCNRLELFGADNLELTDLHRICTAIQKVFGGSLEWDISPKQSDNLYAVLTIR